MPHVWQAIHSLFGPRQIAALPPPVPVVALVVNEQDRMVLASVASQESLDLRFTQSCEQARTVANRLTAPVILLDRDWPGCEWRTTVENLAASPHAACVILVSSVADDYLWQELIRRGGYDVLAKPLRPGKAAQVIKLALSYWTSGVRK